MKKIYTLITLMICTLMFIPSTVKSQDFSPINGTVVTVNNPPTTNPPLPSTVCAIETEDNSIYFLSIEGNVIEQAPFQVNQIDINEGDNIMAMGTLVELSGENGEVYHILDIMVCIPLNNITPPGQIGFVMGTVTTTPIPQTTVVPLPGSVCAIEQDGINYIVSVNGIWSPLNLFTVNGIIFNEGDNVIAMGEIHTEVDYNGEEYHVIEISQCIPMPDIPIIPEIQLVTGILNISDGVCAINQDGTNYFVSFQGNMITELPLEIFGFTFTEGQSVMAIGEITTNEGSNGEPYNVIEVIVCIPVFTPIQGTITKVTDDISTTPPLPENIYAINSNNINYILKIDNEYVTEVPFEFNFSTFDIDDEVIAIGNTAVNIDNNGNTYYTIDMLACIPDINEVTGTITMIESPRNSDNPESYNVCAIHSNSSLDYILVMNESWVTGLPLVIDGRTYNLNDMVTIKGSRSINRDDDNNIYYEINVRGCTGISDSDINSAIYVYNDDNTGTIKINSPENNIKNVRLYSLNGTQIYNRSNINSNNIEISDIVQKGMIIVQIQLSDNTIINKKLIRVK